VKRKRLFRLQPKNGAARTQRRPVRPTITG
jgi:hypothetical protein